MELVKFTDDTYQSLSKVNLIKMMILTDGIV